MAQRRMIYEKMLGNIGFGLLSPNAQVLYIFTIVLADDDGRLKANATALRGRIFPFNSKITDQDVRKYLNEIVKADLVVWYKIEKEYFIQHPNWEKYQILRADRKKVSDIPPPDVNQVATKRGRSKISKISNERETGKPENSVTYLKSIPTEDLFEFYKRFDCTKKALISKGEDLWNYCKSHGKKYNDYKLMMLNALKKDFPERAKDDKLRNSKLMEVDGIMKIVPPEMQEEIKKLANDKTVKP